MGFESFFYIPHMSPLSGTWFADIHCPSSSLTLLGGLWLSKVFSCEVHFISSFSLMGHVGVMLKNSAPKSKA